jgi:hypothetical protein
VTLAASSERPTWILRLTKLNLGMAGRTRYPGEGGLRGQSHTLLEEQVME